MPDLSGDYAGRFVTEVSNKFVSLFQVAANSIVSALFGSFFLQGDRHQNVFPVAKKKRFSLALFHKESCNHICFRRQQKKTHVSV